MSARDDFFAKMQPYADKAAAALGIDAGVILAQWADESANGTSLLARSANNYGGINHSANSIASGADGVFASYKSIDQFVQDYIRVMSLSYYKDVIAAGKKGDIPGTIRALGESPYAASGYDTTNKGIPGADIQAIYDAETHTNAPQTTHPENNNTASLAAIGAATVALFALLSSHK